MTDQNKTELTRKVTAGAATWLTNLGAKPVETEVHVRQGWIADLAAVWCPTRTEAQNAKIIRRTMPWDKVRRMSPGSSVPHQEAREAEYAAIPDMITIAHEVKTAASDFKRDRKWTEASPTSMRVVSVTPDIVVKCKLPEGWWVLLHNSEGVVAKVLQRGPFSYVSDAERMWTILAIATRQWNREHYQLFNDAMKNQLDSLNERKNCERMSTMFRLALALFNGEHETPEQCIRYHATRWKVPKYMMEKARKIFGTLDGTVRQ